MSIGGSLLRAVGYLAADGDEYGYEEDDSGPWHETDSPRETSARESGRLSLVPQPRSRIHLVEPHGFDDAKGIATRFRDGEAEIVDLRGCEPQLRIRLVDFCSGLVYALDGSLQIIDDGILMLSPSHITVSGAAPGRSHAGGFFNQR